MTEHKFTKDELERVMKVVVGDKAGRFPMEDENAMTIIINDVLSKQTIAEAEDTLVKTEEILRRVKVAIKEKKLANKIKKEAERYIEAINILHPNDAKHYTVNAERKAGSDVGHIAVYLKGVMVQHTQIYLGDEK